MKELKTAPGSNFLKSLLFKERLRKYTTFQVALHWIVVALVFGQWLTSDAYYRTRNPFLHARPSDLLEFSIHTWVGASIGVLMLIRLGVGLVLRRPVSAGPRWQRLAAASLHTSLYGLILAQVGTGLLAVYVWPSAGNFHAILWTAIIVVVSLHVLAAATHVWQGDLEFYGMIRIFRTRRR